MSFRRGATLPEIFLTPRLPNVAESESEKKNMSGEYNRQDEFQVCKKMIMVSSLKKAREIVTFCFEK